MLDVSVNEAEDDLRFVTGNLVLKSLSDEFHF